MQKGIAASKSLSGHADQFVETDHGRVPSLAVRLPGGALRGVGALSAPL
jgi:hypothetical protein